MTLITKVTFSTSMEARGTILVVLPFAGIARGVLYPVGLSEHWGHTRSTASQTSHYLISINKSGPKTGSPRNLLLSTINRHVLSSWDQFSRLISATVEFWQRVKLVVLWSSFYIQFWYSNCKKALVEDSTCGSSNSTKWLRRNSFGFSFMRFCSKQVFCKSKWITSVF